MKRNMMIRTLALMLVSLAFLSSAQAQFRASIRGVITDPQGAVVEGATVTLLNTDTNKTLVVKSDANGIYQFNQLQLHRIRRTGWTFRWSWEPLRRR